LRASTFSTPHAYQIWTGAPWRTLPSQYGNWSSVHKRFVLWAEKGDWERFLVHVSKNDDGESVILDSTIIRAHACASGYVKGGNTEQSLGRRKGGFTTKIHPLVDALGNALGFILTPGSLHESTQAPALLQGIKNTQVIGDTDFDSNQLIPQIEKQNWVAVIPPRKNRKYQREYDKDLYGERHLIEFFFGKLKHFPRVFSRFDKKASASAGFLWLASAILWLR
jgi:transposase